MLSAEDLRLSIIFIYLPTHIIEKIKNNKLDSNIINVLVLQWYFFKYIYFLYKKKIKNKKL